MPMSSASGLRLGGMIEGRGNAAASVLISYAPSPIELDRHVHDLLVRIDEPVAYFGDRSERNTRLLHLQHGLRQLHARHAALELCREIRSALLRLVHLIEPLLHHVREGNRGGLPGATDAPP